MDPIVQERIPYDVSGSHRLPGVRPLSMDQVIVRDEAFVGQMAERDRVLQTRRHDVVALQDGAKAAADELLDLVLNLAYPAQAGAAVVRRPDTKSVSIDRTDPLGTVGRLVQEDFCILQKQGDEHVLTGAVLCFPASWMLAEKIGRPLTDIHMPVDGYDPGVATRVQRLFDGVQPGRPMWRYNVLRYNDPDLHQPRSQYAKRGDQSDKNAKYIRSERQVILRLLETRAVVFCIHTFVVSSCAGDYSTIPG
ncbi:DUF3445 domain-containing protein [Aliisedimentitalea scapharcae]|uniref:DUF3445 domain-containing protein n=1 Tax=Aliisedimentitalea scapharcae TaxID=1524259 RepID=A0ABZ2XX95_9RHOB